jgi:hypothetical protein
VLVSTAKYPQNFTVSYFSGLSDGKLSGSTKPNTVLDVYPLSTKFNNKQLYAVIFSDEWSEKGQALSMMLSDTKYVNGQSVTVTGIKSIAHPSKFIRIDAHLGDHAHEGAQFSVAEYKASSDYKDVIKLFESLKYNN